MRHTPQAGTIPVDLTRFGVERALLVGLLLERLRTALDAGLWRALAVRNDVLVRGCRRGLGRCGGCRLLQPGLGFSALLGDDGLDGG